MYCVCLYANIIILLVYYIKNTIQFIPKISDYLENFLLQKKQFFEFSDCYYYY